MPVVITTEAISTAINLMLVGWLFQTLAESGVGEFGAELEQSILAGFLPVLSSISLTGHPAGPSSLLSAPSPVPPTML